MVGGIWHTYLPLIRKWSRCAASERERSCPVLHPSAPAPCWPLDDPYPCGERPVFAYISITVRGFPMPFSLCDPIALPAGTCDELAMPEAPKKTICIVAYYIQYAKRSYQETRAHEGMARGVHYGQQTQCDGGRAVHARHLFFLRSSNLQLAERSGCRTAPSLLQFQPATVAMRQPLRHDVSECMKTRHV